MGLGLGLGFGHRHKLGLSLKLGFECGVCRQEPPKAHEYGMLWIEDREYNVSIASFLRLQNILVDLLERGKKFDPLIICPACQGVCEGYRDQNYRRRARRFIRRSKGEPTPTQTAPEAQEEMP